MEHSEQILLTRSEAARMLSVSLDTIDDLCKSGVLRKRYLKDYIEVGTNRVYQTVPRILKSDVTNYVSEKFGLNRKEA